jgi:transmembrane sensor
VEAKAVTSQQPVPTDAETRRLLEDPALKEALRRVAETGRLSTDEIKAMRSSRRRAMTAGLVVALLAGAGGWLGRSWLQPALSRSTTLEYATRAGETREVRTADGSVLELNGASRVRLTFAADHREAKLLAGEVFFDIHHDEKRPFTVIADRSETRVLGTAFDIDMTRREVALAVYRGAVRFAGRDGARAVVVKAGWHTRLTAGGIAAPEQFDPAQADWRQGWIDSSAITLGDLVEVLNRRSARPIAAPPAPLDELKISGRFRIDDPGQLLASLGAAYGFTVKAQPGALVIAPASAN